ncbi:MAG: nitrate/nitrite transporter NrtS [Limnothrix sp.]
MKTYLQALRNPEMTPTAIRVALVVGTILFMINHGNALAQGKMNRSRWFAAVLTYVVPYCVNIHGQMSCQIKYSQRDQPESDESIVTTH